MLKSEVVISSGVEVKLENGNLVVIGPKGELQRGFKHPRVKVELKADKIIFTSELERKKFKALIGTWRALLKNMVFGVTKGWQCKLKLVYAHFPVKLEIEGEKLFIKNFLGERKPRVAKILPDTEIKIEKDVVKVTGIDKEKVGQCAANIERATKVKGYDRRVFSDGVYILGKPKLMETEKVD